MSCSAGRKGGNMSEHGHRGHCRDCGGTGGHHYNGCTYDGVDSGRSHRSSLPDSIRWILLIGAVIFMGLFPPLGVLLMTIVLFC